MTKEEIFTFVEDPNKYHIYFNNEKKEIKRNYFKENEKPSKIRLIIDMEVKSLQQLFINCDFISVIYCLMDVHLWKFWI